MNRIIHQEISNCGECPFLSWESDHSESNSDGCSICKKENREIAWDYRNPPIPKWCPLQVDKSQDKK